MRRITAIVCESLSQLKHMLKKEKLGRIEKHILTFLYLMGHQSHDSLVKKTLKKNSNRNCAFIIRD